MKLPDTLLRPPSIWERDEISFKLHVNHIASTDTTLTQVFQGTESSPVLSTVNGLVNRGWHVKCRQASRIAHKYWNMRDELTVDNGLLLNGPTIIIPTAPRQSFLHHLLEHTSTTNCHLAARSLIYGLASMEI